jgi:CRISPR-associated exonuclease Cas4
MMQLLALTLIALALLLLAGAIVLRRRSGLPWGRVSAEDMAAGRTLQRPLVSRRLGLVGKPDYILERGRAQIPVEVKPGRRAATPYASDLMQLAAYCVLIEETSGAAPPYGLLRYAEQTFRMPYTASVRERVLAVLDEMYALLEADDAARSHDDARRCAGCGFQATCEDSLAG